MHGYRRPTLPVPEFRDGEGSVIPYGRRWGGESPPEHTYSVVSHPERFAPLADVADALFAAVEREFEVAVQAGFGAADLMRPRGDLVRVTRWVPADPEAAPLTLAVTTFPGLLLEAGGLHDFPLPQCGCDACDETAESAADELEDIVSAVVEGRFREDVGPGRRPAVGYRIRSPDGSAAQGGSQTSMSVPAERLVRARWAMRHNGGVWAPWPVRR